MTWNPVRHIIKRAIPYDNRVMDLAGWDARYRSPERAREDDQSPPTPMLVNSVQGVQPGRALDLACGSGRNSLWLARKGWDVTAVDGAPAAIARLENRASAARLAIATKLADLQSGDFTIEEESWDLIAFLYYLQRDLFRAISRGVRPGGLVIGIVHTTFPGEEPTAHRLRPGELLDYFKDWKIVHSYEGPPNDPAHKRLVAEVVAQRATETTSA